MKKSHKYVLMTAAYNEAAHIEATIQSVLAQTMRPVKWVIVSDGSTDDTDRIIKAYAEKRNFIVYTRRIKESKETNFASKVLAIRHGYERLAGQEYDFIGILDADITLEESYYEKLIDEFQKNQKLGIAGGLLYEESNGKYKPRTLSEIRYVPGAVQLFRRACYEQVGGYVTSRWGGEDTIAVVTARMKGWETRSIPGIQGYHHKNSDASRGYFNEWFRNGVMFYTIGSNPLVELMKSLRYMTRKPYILGGVIRIYGLMWAACSGKERPVSDEFIKYLRNEQWLRLK
jgi:poly-beta-1,6-N-acetyl-D-glucosamine synthase